MTPTECVKLVALINARCPQQRLEPATADTWFVDLQQASFVDAAEAVRRVTAARPFCSLSELLEQLRLLRNERVQRSVELPPVGSGAPMPAEIREMADGLFRLPAGTPHPDISAQARRYALSRRCPYCAAHIGEGCVSTMGGRPIPVPHPSRFEVEAAS